MAVKDALDEVNDVGEAIRAKRVEAMSQLVKGTPKQVWAVMGITDGVPLCYGAFTDENAAWEVFGYLMETEPHFSVGQFDVQCITINQDDFGVL